MTPIELLTNLKGAASLAGAPFGADIQALVAAAKARNRLALYVARDESAAEAALKLIQFFDPGMETIPLPGWDTLPYDRVSPSPGVAARRCAGLARLARADDEGARIAVTTASSLAQRVPPLSTLRKASFAVSEGRQVDQNALTEYLSVNGYVRASTVRERGEFAIRGGIIDIFAPTEAEPIRLDFFGDTLEGLKAFDPETQRSTRQIKSAAFAPVSEILFSSDVMSGFRERYLERIGPPNGDPVYDAARAGIRRQGVEALLPLFHEQLEILFDYIDPDALVAFGHLAGEACAERLSQADDYYAARLEGADGDSAAARVLPPKDLYLTPESWTLL